LHVQKKTSWERQITDPWLYITAEAWISLVDLSRGSLQVLANEFSGREHSDTARVLEVLCIGRDDSINGMAIPLGGVEAISK